MKTCTECKEVKVLEDFHKDKELIDGRKNKCKTCMSKTYRLNKNNGRCAQCLNPVFPGKATCEDCIQKHSSWSKDRFEARKGENLCTSCGVFMGVNTHNMCLVCTKNQSKNSRSYYLKLKSLGLCVGGCGELPATDMVRCEPCLEILRVLRKPKPEHTRIKQNSKQRKRRQDDINFRIAGSLRGRMNDALKRGLKTGSAVRDLGCAIPEFKIYLESLWTTGMSWENYGLGQNKWHIDHIIPLISFNLSDREEFLKAAHFTNQQPLWAKDNIRKSDLMSDGSRGRDWRKKGQS